MNTKENKNTEEPHMMVMTLDLEGHSSITYVIKSGRKRVIIAVQRKENSHKAEKLIKENSFDALFKLGTREIKIFKRGTRNIYTGYNQSCIEI